MKKVGNEHYCQVQELLNVGSWEWDIQTGDLFCSDTIESLFGLGYGEFEKTYDAFVACIHPDDRKKVADAVQQSIDDREKYYIRHRIIWPNGEVHWVEEHGTVFYGEDGTPLKMVGVVKNIAEKIEYENTMFQLGVKDAFVDMLMEGIDQHALVSITDVDGIIIYCNDKFCKTSKYSREELIGNNHSIVKSDFHTPKFWVEFWERIQSGIHFRGLIKNKAKDGAHYWVDTSVLPFRNDAGEITKFISVRTEVTKQVKTKEQFKKYKEELEILVGMRDKELEDTQSLLAKHEKWAMLGEMSSGLAHELNNPLLMIKGYAKQLYKNFTKDSGKDMQDSIRYLERIEKNVVRMTKIISHYRNFSRNQTPEKLELNLGEVINDSLELIRDQLRTSNVKINVKLENIDDAYIVGNKTQIEQVLINLIGNAKDAIVAARVDNQRCLEIFTENTHGYFIIHIKDNGGGIPPEEINNVFTPLFTTKKEGSGTGLGLSIAQNIVKDHHGIIECNSQKGIGTTFSLFFPKCESKAANKVS